ncbi:MAG: hypothetical protein ACQKBU_07875 [Verrucomicrobiales bacterium]
MKNFRHPSLLAAAALAGLLFLTGCETGFDRAMNFKDAALQAKKETAILALGGEIVETTTTTKDESGNDVVTVTKTTRMAASSSQTSANGAGMTLEPGARVDFGSYVRNTGAVPITVDPRIVMGNSGEQRRVAETEKLALLEAFWGETGNFIPKTTWEETINALTRIGLGWFIYDTAGQVIQSNNGLSMAALEKEPTVVEPLIFTP